ncbi:MAG: universal stress protein [Planctomycetes bacterium]|nr:universal stress protein [Planctomycetota bacterium]
MISLKKVLLATDFSDCGQSAQDYAFEFATQFQADLHILHVIVDTTLTMAGYGAAMALTPGFLEGIEQHARQSAEKIASAAKQRGLKTTAVVKLGDPAQTIVDYAAGTGIDLIILGTHGRSGFVQLMLGSCAEKVVRKAPCPVLTVRPAGHQFVSS